MMGKRTDGYDKGERKERLWRQVGRNTRKGRIIGKAEKEEGNSRNVGDKKS